MSALTSALGSALQGLWRSQAPEPCNLETIRQAMVDALEGQAGPLARRIRYSGDVQRLWYLRPELMEAVAARRGEAAARQTLLGISALFRGGLPQGLSCGRGGLRCPSRS